MKSRMSCLHLVSLFIKNHFKKLRIVLEIPNKYKGARGGRRIQENCDVERFAAVSPPPLACHVRYRGHVNNFLFLFILHWIQKSLKKSKVSLCGF